MASFEFGQNLGIKIKVQKIGPSMSRNKASPLLPSFRNRNEIQRRGKFDVDMQPVLEGRDGTVQAVPLRHHLEINVNRAFAPPEQDRRSSPGQINPYRLGGLLTQRPQEGVNSLSIS